MGKNQNLTWVKIALWAPASILMWFGLYALATASTVEPFLPMQQDAVTGMPYFAAQGPQCWSMKHGGSPIDCEEIDSIEEPAPFDVPRWVEGRFETPLETFKTTGCYCYLGDTPAPSPVPLPAAGLLLMAAFGLTAAASRMKR